MKSRGKNETHPHRAGDKGEEGKGEEVKRDVELIRKILFTVEKHDHPWMYFEIDKMRALEGYDWVNISYHVMILNEAGLLIAREHGFISGREVWQPYRLTWEGHELLDAMRSDDGWGKAQKAMKQAGGFTIDVLKSLLVDYLKQEGRKFLGG